MHNFFCFALAISRVTLPFVICQPVAFSFMKRVLLFRSYQEKLKTSGLFNSFSVPAYGRVWAGEGGGVGEVLYV